MSISKATININLDYILTDNPFDVDKMKENNDRDEQQEHESEEQDMDTEEQRDEQTDQEDINEVNISLNLLVCSNGRLLPPHRQLIAAAK